MKWIHEIQMVWRWKNRIDQQCIHRQFTMTYWNFYFNVEKKENSHFLCRNIDRTSCKSLFLLRMINLNYKLKFKVTSNIEPRTQNCINSLLFPRSLRLHRVQCSPSPRGCGPPPEYPVPGLHPVPPLLVPHVWLRHWYPQCVRCNIQWQQDGMVLVWKSGQRLELCSGCSHQ